MDRTETTAESLGGAPETTRTSDQRFRNPCQNAGAAEPLDGTAPAGGLSLCTTVAALYVDPRGPYPGLVREWYDEARDAKAYNGPWPVVAHPPCGPWGRLRHLCTRQERAGGPHAVEMVRRYGGVLEHPEISRLFFECGLPLPGELPDAWGGRTYAVRQVAWGHKCEKPTWLYVVGVSARLVVDGIRTGGASTHVISNNERARRLGLKCVTASERRRTPLPFAKWLVELAASAADEATQNGDAAGPAATVANGGG